MKPNPRNILISAHLKNAVLWSACICCSIGTSRAGAPATDTYWDGTGISWGTVGDWSNAVGVTTDPAAIPGASEAANFSISSINTAQTVNLDANRSAAGLVFHGTNTATTSLLGGGTDRTLTLGTGGIVVDELAGAVTIGSATSGQAVNMILGAAQSWTNNSANALTVQTNTANMAYALTVGGTGDTSINGYLGAFNSSSLTGGLTKTGSGTLTLSTGGKVSIRGAQPWRREP